MTNDQLFLAVNVAALPFWALMIFAPGWSVTRRVMESFLAPGVFAVVYAVLVVPALPALLPLLLAPPDLKAIAAALGDPGGGTVLAWVHFLAFDLFVGRWEYLDARQRGLSHWLLAPSLLLTLYFGPLGLLLYLACRWLGTPQTPGQQPPRP